MCAAGRGVARWIEMGQVEDVGCVCCCYCCGSSGSGSLDPGADELPHYWSLQVMQVKVARQGSCRILPR